MVDEKTQVEEVKENPQGQVDMSNVPAEPETPKTTQKGGFRFKYYCEACSGRAFLSEDKSSFEGARTCQSCGAAVTFSEGNYLPLNDSERETLNG